MEITMLKAYVIGSDEKQFEVTIEFVEQRPYEPARYMATIAEQGPEDGLPVSTWTVKAHGHVEALNVALSFIA